MSSLSMTQVLPVFVQGLVLCFGLIVAIPALMFWRYFRARVDDYLLSMELAAERFARHLATLRR